MADPVSIIGMTASAASGVVGAAGAQYQGAAQSNMYNYQAGVATVNAQLAKQDAIYAQETGEVSAQQSGMKTRAEVGATKVGFGAGNVAGGSTNRVLASETDIGQENQALIRANAAKRAFGFDVKSAEDVAQAGAYRVAAETSRKAGDISAISSILGGAGSVASKWMQYGTEFPGMGGGGGAAGSIGGSL